jgi:Protease subunit of ATP-dependent Clp proteases
MNSQTKGLLDETFGDVAAIMDTVLPEPDLLEFYRRLERREILWNTFIDENTIDVSMYILKWNSEDKKIPVENRVPIKIYINSDGGCVNTVMHIIDIIKLSKTPVYTIGLGKAYSSGGLLLMAGHKRYIFPNTCCLIHDGSSGAFGNTSKLLDNLEYTKEIESKVQEYILSHTKISKELFKENYRKDWYLFSEDILKYGIADYVVTDLEDVL